LLEASLEIGLVLCIQKDKLQVFYLRLAACISHHNHNFESEVLRFLVNHLYLGTGFVYNSLEQHRPSQTAKYNEVYFFTALYAQVTSVFLARRRVRRAGSFQDFDFANLLLVLFTANPSFRLVKRFQLITRLLWRVVFLFLLGFKVELD
jgi:hypothetical protein